jgi:hypothetical protein
MKNKSPSINVGSSSILMIFVVLCLVCFASLSLISANADYRLSEKFAAKTQAYYEASNKAETSISEINQVLIDKASTLDEKAYFDSLEDNDTLSFYISINEQQSLYVNMLPVYPTDAHQTHYQLSDYQIVTTNPVEPDTSIDFYTP